LAYFDYQAAEGEKDTSLSIALGPEGHQRTITLEKTVLLP
jgi:hypothetical protein